MRQGRLPGRPRGALKLYEPPRVIGAFPAVSFIKAGDRIREEDTCRKRRWTSGSEGWAESAAAVLEPDRENEDDPRCRRRERGEPELRVGRGDAHGRRHPDRGRRREAVHLALVRTSVPLKSISSFSTTCGGRNGARPSVSAAMRASGQGIWSRKWRTAREGTAKRSDRGPPARGAGGARRLRRGAQRGSASFRQALRCRIAAALFPARS